MKAEDIIPDGILPTDHWHVDTYDQTCSRCRETIPDHHVPLQFYQCKSMLSYCETCCGVPAEVTEARAWGMGDD